MAQGASDPGRGPLAIALVHFAAPPVVGGVERVLADHAMLMANAGHAVRIVAGRGAAPDPRIRFVEVPLMNPRDPTIARLQAALDDGQVPADFAAVVALIAADLAGALAGVDVVVAHNVCSINLNLALTAALRAVTDAPGSPRLILWHHDLAGTAARESSRLHPGAPWDLLRTAWPRASQVVVSEGRQAELAAIAGIHPESIAVIPNGVDMAAMLKLEDRTRELVAGAGLADAAPILLVPSRITPRKNVELALRVVAAMRAAGRPAAVIVSGPVDPHWHAGHEYWERLVALRHELGLDEAARFLSEDPAGSPSDAMMRDLYRLADVLFLPSRDEGFGLPILEAAINRLPIVCTDLPALRELAGDAALYVGPDDDPVEVAARVLERLDVDPVGRLSQVVRARFGWEAIYRERIAPLLAAG